MQITMINTAISANSSLRPAFGHIHPHTVKIPRNIPAVRVKHPENKSLRFIVLTDKEHTAVSILKTKIRSTRRLLAHASSGSAHNSFKQELEALTTAKDNLVRHYYEISGPHPLTRQSRQKTFSASVLSRAVMPLFRMITFPFRKAVKSPTVATEAV